MGGSDGRPDANVRFMLPFFKQSQGGGWTLAFNADTTCIEAADQSDSPINLSMKNMFKFGAIEQWKSCGGLDEEKGGANRGYVI